MRLTDLAIRKLPIPERGQKTYFEGEGFGIRISQGGTRTFVQMYGKDRRLKSLGRYPDISLREARKAAKVIQATPEHKKRSERTTEAVSVFLADCENRLRPATVANYRTYLERIEDKKLSEVTREEVSYSDHSTMAAKVFFNWCIREGLTEHNPVQHTKITPNHRSRFLSDEEIQALWRYEAPPFTDYLKLLLLTGQRRSQFSNFAIRGDTLFFPKEVMKGKADHTIPLLPLARSYAEKLQPFNGWSKCKARADKQLQFSPWVIHDLRRTFSTVMASLRVPLHVTEKILDHRSGQVSGVAAIYNRHDFIEEAREALALYEQHIQTLTA